MIRYKYIKFLFAALILILSSGYERSVIQLSAEGIKSNPSHGDKIKIGGLDFIFVRGGDFFMGSNQNRGYSNERPGHRVIVNSFWMSIYEITQNQYQAIMKNNPSNFRGDTRPVEQVSWYKAVEYCSKFSSRHGIKARLPYEAEWEYAARSGTGALYYWGNSINNAYCWYNVNSGDSSHPVGRKKPNKWGLYDMSGNVFEWCLDFYSDSYYKDSPRKNPPGPDKGTSRVARGGSWHNNKFNLRSAFRVPFRPETAQFINGFRIIIPAGK